ncbi:hypothetical protein KAFR_0C03410 [Kazachstania africana CBS 2517]|uniref:Transcription activator GCR1-like domain-containing protein n=1 Tax=Kazachstania africana (strain ATCC 22294 / BCRC 22015 / CBS 2517 / CECT 1963 / NBRC 1671 / NRRL Y-8276) TaxID=1071382 RepID=H2ASI3_KAZAF|nr:hypothetical protein KAFR_0C03410 [Kazachstania africana CBS 2517]CCF57333.1 hypothetical protein KAFR_0C03410 [Kazachstania africana CBS 2517]
MSKDLELLDYEGYFSGHTDDSDIDAITDIQNILDTVEEMKLKIKLMIIRVDNIILDKWHTYEVSNYEYDPTIKDLLSFLSQLSKTIENIPFQEEERRSKLDNHGVILIKWPGSIAQLWEEYDKVPRQWHYRHLLNFLVDLEKLIAGGRLDSGDLKIILNRNVSIRDLEARYGASWRQTDKNLSRQINRRKKVWQSIEQGLRDGLKLEECIGILEKYIEESNQSLSNFYKGVPFRLYDRRYII